MICRYTTFLAHLNEYRYSIHGLGNRVIYCFSILHIIYIVVFSIPSMVDMWFSVLISMFVLSLPSLLFMMSPLGLPNGCGGGRFDPPKSRNTRAPDGRPVPPPGRRGGSPYAIGGRGHFRTLCDIRTPLQT